MIPVVSAIMPTRLRGEMADAAVRMFHDQTWARKELIIIDDVTGRSFDRFATGWNPDGVYYGLAPNLTIGEKRNVAIANASGEIIMHWDSDDIYSPDRMLDQVIRLLENDGAEMTGYHAMEFVDEAGQHRYLYDCGPGHAIGVSMCYWRSAWEFRRFRHIEEGEDMDFARGRRIASAPADGRIVARIHEGNTSDKRTAIARNPAMWKSIPWEKEKAA